MRNLSQNIDRISDEYGADIRMLDENRMYLRLEDEKDIIWITQIIKKYLGNVRVIFTKRPPTLGEIDIYDIRVVDN